MDRRDALRVLGTGALCALLPGAAGAGDPPGYPATEGQGLIFLVGDGMPLGVVRGMHEVRTRLYGDRQTNFYAKMKDPASAVGYAATASLSSIVTDSAPASVAWSTGSKTINKVLASLPDGRPLTTILELLRERGYACGLVTTTRVTHATPAAWVSHQLDRDKEEDIALEYLRFKPDVLLGGGSRFFDPARRKDRADVLKAFTEQGYDVVRSRDALLSDATASSSKPLLGVFSPSHLDYCLDRMNQPELAKAEPSLPEMTGAALQRLAGHPKGFILLVEAGRIDHANHNNDAWASMLETYELDQTLGVIDEFRKANPKTLVIVASDHGTAGWGLNGTGPEYNDSTEALRRYQPIRASLELMKKKWKPDASLAEIKDVFEHFTTYKITDAEAALISRSMQPDFIGLQGDYTIQPEATMAHVLSHSVYERTVEIFWAGKALVRRGNVGFTSSHHTGEDQIVLAYGHRALDLGLNRYMDNTYLFEAVCRYFQVQHKNPAMTEEEARPFVKTASLRDWRRHMALHVG